MKVDLTDQQKKQLQRMMDSNPIRRFMQLKENLNFEVGDVLVKLHFRLKDYSDANSGSWIPEAVSYENKMPQRYVVIHKDEYGICYLKQLKVSNGQLGKDTFVVTDYLDEHTKFDVDPEYAEKIFLDAEFDIKDLHKKSLEARKIVSKLNRKSGIKPKTLKEFNDFFNGMKVGDKFWVTHDFTAKRVMEYEITKTEAITIHQLELKSDWSWKSFKDLFKSNPVVGINDNFALKIYYKDITYRSSPRESMCFDLGRGSILYKQQPAQEDKSK